MQIKEICELTGKTRQEIEKILDKDGILELNLNDL